MDTNEPFPQRSFRLRRGLKKFLCVVLEATAQRACFPEGEEIRQPHADGPKTYTSASKDQVQVVGESSPTCAFPSDESGLVELRVLDPLKKALLSVSKMNRTHIVHLDGDQSWAKNRKTGKDMRIYIQFGITCCQLFQRQTLLRTGVGRSNSIQEQSSKRTMHVDGNN